MATFYPGYIIQILGPEDWPEDIPLGVRQWDGIRYPVDTVEEMVSTYGSDTVYQIKSVKIESRFENSPTMCLLDNGYWYASGALSIVDDTPAAPYTAGDIVYANNGEGNIEVFTIEEINYNDCSLRSLQSDSYYNRFWSDVHLFTGDIDSLPKLRRCSRCGATYTAPTPEDNIYPEDVCLCETCRRRRYVASYNCYKPHLLFYGRNGLEDFKNEALYLGTEIEMAGGGENNFNAAKIMDRWEELGYDNFVYITHDGSLRSQGGDVDGFEMVTKPATLEFHKKIAEEYKNVFKLSTKMGYRAHNTSCCGLHVHINRGFFGNREETAIMNMLYLFDKFWDKIQIFSRRDPYSLGRYARRISLDWDDEAYFDHFNQNDEDHDGHYYSVNITNPGTIEVRVFKGTLNYNTYLLTLEFVANLAKVCRDVRRIETVEFTDLLSPEGLEYYNSRLMAQKYEVEN